MIITRTPFRISFAGGGTDLASFYQRRPGCVLSATIDKYMYIAVHPYFHKGVSLIKYSQTEKVTSPADVKHPIIRQAMLDLDVHGVDVNSIADIPAGTGLGSSSAFTVGILHAMYGLKGRHASKERLASEACGIEIEKLGERIGKQDQYASAYGGLNFITFHPGGEVNVEPILLSGENRSKLEGRLKLFYTGDTREAGSILKRQDKGTREDASVFNMLEKMAGLAETLRDSLREGDIDSFGQVLHEGWLMKRELTGGITNERIDKYYEIAMTNGAEGGKLLGAGGGGFLLFYCKEENQERLKAALSDLDEYDFSFDHFGSKIIYVGEKDG